MTFKHGSLPCVMCVVYFIFAFVLFSFLVCTQASKGVSGARMHHYVCFACRFACCVRCLCVCCVVAFRCWGSCTPEHDNIPNTSKTNIKFWYNQKQKQTEGNTTQTYLFSRLSIAFVLFGLHLFHATLLYFKKLILTLYI